jgi:hypothetical protein
MHSVKDPLKINQNAAYRLSAILVVICDRAVYRSKKRKSTINLICKLRGWPGKCRYFIGLSL